MTLSRKELIELMAKARFKRDGIRLPWDEAREDVQAAYRSLVEHDLSILDQAGMVIVPREPSEAMVDAAYCLPSTCGTAMIETFYRVMIEASQEGQQP